MIKKLGVLNHLLRTSVLLLISQTVGVSQARVQVSVPEEAPIITVGRNVMVSAKHPGWEHVEYVADADPLDANHLIVCSMRFSGARNQLTSAVYVSNDGGRVWSIGYDDSSSRFAGVYDPACSYGIKHQAFFVTLPSSDEAPGRWETKYEDWGRAGSKGMHLFTSTGGKEWAYLNDVDFIDRPDLRVDHTHGRYRGRIYIYGNSSGENAWLAFSSDGCQTWIRSTQTHMDRASLEEDGPSTILPDGTLVLPYCIVRKVPNGLSRIQAIAVSTDGGEHITQPLAVLTSAPVCHEGSISLAADHSSGPFRGRAYAVWAEGNAVFVSHSDDKGRTWSAGIRVSGASNAATMDVRPMSRIAVNSNGIVGITWYDSTKKNGRRESLLRFSASVNGGETWLPNIPVSTHGFVEKQPPEFSAYTLSLGGGSRRELNATDTIDVRVGPSPRSYYIWNAWPGDYSGIAVGADGVFHAFWIDNRTGRSELYTARVTVRGDVALPKAQFKYQADGGLHPEPASAPLSTDELDQGAPFRSDRPIARTLVSQSEISRGFENVTSSLEFQCTSSVWNPMGRFLTIRYQLLNTSQNKIVGPLNIKIVRIESDLGVPTLFAANGRQGSGRGLIDSLPLTISGGLAPGRKSKPQTLLIKFKIVRGLTGNHRDLLHMQLMAYSTMRRRGT